jgi:FkbM family methyltransferase
MSSRRGAQISEIVDETRAEIDRQAAVQAEQSDLLRQLLTALQRQSEQLAEQAAQIKEIREDLAQLNLIRLEVARVSEASDAVLQKLDGALEQGQRQLEESQKQLQQGHQQGEILRRVEEFSDKALHLTSLHYSLYQTRSDRPYYSLDNGWALTHLDNGQPFFVNTTDRQVAPWVIMGGHWEPDVERGLVGYAQPGMTVIDIGAHMGYFTVKLGRKIGPTGRLLAFEPNPLMNTFTYDNIRLNDLMRSCTLHCVALGEKPGTGSLRHHPNNMGGGSLIDQRDGECAIDVPVRRLDDMVPADWSVDLIKLDAEGYEQPVLRGAAAVLARSPDCAVMLELRLESWERQGTLGTFLEDCGGGKTVYAVRPDGSLLAVAPEEVRNYLLNCLRVTGFHECNFFVAPAHLVERYLPDLLVVG